MISYWKKIKSKVAVKAFQRLYKNLPTSEAKYNLTLKMFKESMEHISLTREGLVFIDPFDILVDRDGNVYVVAGGDYALLQVRHKATPKEEKITDSIWPDFLT